MAWHTATRSRFHAILGLATGAAVLCLASSAWACTPTPELFLQTTSGLPQSRVLVHGTNFIGQLNGQPSPVTIRWGTVSGPALAAVVGPEFRVYVVVPADAAPGTYVIGAAQQGNPQGDVWRAEPFTVRGTSSTATTAPTEGPVAGDPGPEPQSEPAASPTQTQAQSPAPTAGSSPAATAATPVATPTAAVADRRDPAPAPSSSPAAAPAISPLPSGSVTKPAPPVFGSQAGVQVATPIAVATEPSDAPAVAPAPPKGPESAALPQGVWSTDAARSGMDIDRSVASHGAAGAAGVAFLAVGASLLLAGFLVITVARRQSTAQGMRPPTP